jgi:capsular exopolysaccharide synthesis family protein
VSAFVGVLLAFCREYLDTTVHSKEQVERLVGLPLLATIPTLASPERRRRRPQEPLGQANGSVPWPLNTPMTEALRHLHTRLRHLNGQQPIQTVLLTSAGPDDDTALLLVQLAMLAASTGEKTLLIDANLRHATLHSLLHCHLAPGLAEMLATPEHWQQGIQHTSLNSLHVVAAGIVTSTTPISLDTPAFDVLLAHYKAAYDFILCTAPALPEYTDAAVLGHRADATCLVLTCGVSRLDTILEAKNALEAVQAKVAGAILTDGSSERTRPR